MTAVQHLITDHLDLWTTAIKHKSSAGRGSNKKIELYGIKKLRELILELAVRGLLVPQDPSDAPASELLKKIAAEKTKLIKAGQLKKQKPLPPISDDEKPFALPKGWEWSCLYQISEIAPRNNLEDNLEVSFVPMPMISTSYKGEHDHEVKIWADIKKGYTHFADGDIGLAKITPCFENSKAAVFNGLKNGFGAGTTELHIARPIANTIEPLFILLYLKAPMFLEKGKTKMTGSAGQKRVPTDYFSYNPLPLAPLAEQQRIVAKVDELMQLCDQLELQTENSINAHQVLVEQLLTAITKPEATASATALELLFANFDSLFTTAHSIDQLKQSILQLAVMGKLVPQDPNDEPASELLKKIAAEKNKLIKADQLKKQKPLPPISDEEKPFQLPKGWEWVRLGEISNYGICEKAESRDVNPDTWVLELEDVEKETSKVLQRKRFSERNFKSSKNVFRKGDVIYGKLRPYLDKVIVADEDGVCTTEMVPFRAYMGVTSNFIKLTMKSTSFKEYANNSTHGMNLPRVGTDKARLAVIPLCPETQQQRIVAKVDILMTLCDQLKAALARSQSTQLLLADALAEQALAV